MGSVPCHVPGMDDTVCVKVAARGRERGVFATKSFRLELSSLISNAKTTHKMPGTAGWHAFGCGSESVLFDTFVAIVRIRVGT